MAKEDEDDLQATLEAAFATTEDKADDKSDVKADARAADSTADKASDGNAKASPKADDKAESSKDDKATDKADKADRAAPKYSYREPPSRWTSEAKDAWAKAFGAIDPENPTHKQIGALRDMIHQRFGEMEADYTKKTSDASDTQKRYAEIEQVLGPRRSAIEASGATVAKALGDLMQVNDFATNQPENFVKWFMERRGLDARKLFPQAPARAAGQTTGLDPEDPLGVIPQSYKDAVKAVPSLVQRIDQLQGQLGQVSSQWQGFRSESQASEVNAARQHVSSWSAETDGSGNLLRPHYESVRPRMTQLLEQGMAQDLNTAYDMAIHMDSGIRQQIADSQRAASIAASERQAAATAARKRAAGSSVTGGTAGGMDAAAPRATGGDDIHQMLREAFDAAESRARV